MIRVLYIVDEGNVGGAAHSFVEVMSQMRQKGVTPVVCNSIPNDLNEFLNAEGIENYSIGHPAAILYVPTRSWKRPFIKAKLYLKYIKACHQSMLRVAKLIDMKSIDLIHTNSARNDIGCYISRKYKIPHIVHFREFGDLDFDCAIINPFYFSLMNHHAMKFITISDAVKRHWVKKGLKAQKAQTIYNGIHWQNISVSLDAFKKEEILHMIITGGVFPTKGQHLAVDAMCMLPDELKHKFTLDVMGWYGEEYVDEMQKKAADYGIGNQVHFHGRRNDVPQQLGNYQIGLMCSRMEGFGRSTAEYMHARLGVIASDSGANPELIKNFETGLLFKSGDAVSLCECLKKYYYDRELLIKCSNNAQSKARSCYTDTMNADNIFKIYHSLVFKR